MDGLARPQSPDMGQKAAAPAVNPESVYKGHMTFVWQMLQRYGVPERDLADVTQNCFMTISRRLDSYDQSRPMRPWLRGIARRAASEYRQQSYVVREALTEPPERAARQPSADERLVDAEMLDLLAEILNRMDEEKREVFELNVFGDVPVPAIAVAQGVPVATAYSRLRLAREEIDEAMGRHRAREEREVAGEGSRCPGRSQVSSPAAMVVAAGSSGEKTPSNDVDRLLGLERQRAEPPAALQDEMWNHLRRTLQLPPGDVGDSSSSGPSVPHGHGGPAVGPGPTVLASAGGAVAGAHPVLRTVLALAVGSGAGAGVHQVLDNAAMTPAPIVAGPPAVSRRAAPPEALVPEPPVPEPPVPPPPTATATVEARPAGAGAKSTRPPAPDPRERDRDLTSERALIEQARTALWRHKGADALTVLQRHARTYPHGALEEERESLRVRALADADRADEAHKAAASFHRQFPQSIFGSVVDEALGGAP